jgi:hypothetical protein
VCTGGNIESSLLVRVIEKGLVSDGRVARIRGTFITSSLHLNVVSWVESSRFMVRYSNHSRTTTRQSNNNISKSSR